MLVMCFREQLASRVVRQDSGKDFPGAGLRIGENEVGLA